MLKIRLKNSRSILALMKIDEMVDMLHSELTRQKPKDRISTKN